MRRTLRFRSGSMCFALFFVFALMLAGASWAQAPQQQPGGGTGQPATAPNQQKKESTDVCATLSERPRASVTDAYKVEVPKRAGVPVPGKTPEPETVSRRVKLRDTIAVRMANFGTLLDQLKCDERDGRDRSIVLYLDDRPLVDVAAFPPTDPSQPLLMFPLRRTEASREVWTDILGKPGWRPRDTKVSIGIEDRFAIPSTAYVQLWVLPRGWFTFWALLFSALLISFLVLAWKSDVLRDAGMSSPAGVRRPFSLARTQAAWWFFFILAAYLFIGVVTGDFSTSITGTVLVLLGISAGTTVASAVIDRSKATPEEQEKEKAAIQALDAEIQQLETDMRTTKTTLTATPKDMAATRLLANQAAQWAAKRSQLRKLWNESEGLHLDILSDANGVNFHRFQMAAWTIVLGIIFIAQVYRELAMPQFNETLLGLMGISAGTFLGLKGPEPTVPDTQK